MTKSVLVVDDEEDVREVLFALISRWGFEVATAADGREALARMRAAAPPHLVLLDLAMPDLNGWGVRAEMLADPELAAIPVVLVSGAADALLQSRALQAQEALVKPIDIVRLQAILRAHLGAPRGAAGSSSPSP